MFILLSFLVCFVNTMPSTQMGTIELNLIENKYESVAVAYPFIFPSPPRLAIFIQDFDTTQYKFAYSIIYINSSHFQVEFRLWPGINNYLKYVWVASLDLMVSKVILPYFYPAGQYRIPFDQHFEEIPQGQFFISQYNGLGMDIEIVEIMNYGIVLDVNQDINLVELIFLSCEECLKEIGQFSLAEQDKIVKGDSLVLYGPVKADVTLLMSQESGQEYELSKDEGDAQINYGLVDVKEIDLSSKIIDEKGDDEENVKNEEEDIIQEEQIDNLVKEKVKEQKLNERGYLVIKKLREDKQLIVVDVLIENEVKKIEEVCSKLNVTFIDITVRFSYKTKSIGDQQCQMNITINHTVRNKEFYVSYENEKSYKKEVDFDLYSDSQFDVGNVLKEIVISYQAMIMPLFFISLFFGGIEFLWQLLDLQSWINVMYFINVRYPPNVKQIFAYTDWIYISFYPEPFELKKYGFTPQRFQEKDVSDYFIENVLFALFYILLSLILYPMAYAIKAFLEVQYAVYYKQQTMTKLPQKLSRRQSQMTILYHQNQQQYFIVEKTRKQDFLDMPKIYQSLYKSAEQYNLHFIGIVLNVVNLTFLDFQMASLLQLLFSPLNDFMLIFNLILSIICQILIIAIILYYWKRLNQSEDTLKHQIYKQRFGLLYEQFKIRKNYSQYYMLIVTIKKILFMNLLILFFFYPFVQSLSLLFICLNDILFLLYDFPFVSIKDSIGTMMIEQTLFLTIIGSTLLAYQDSTLYFSSDQVFEIGWFMVGSISVAIVYQLLSIVYYVLKGMKEKLYFLRNLWK